MNQDEAFSLEAQFGIQFPPEYRRAVTDACPFRGPTEELDTDAESLRKTNEGFRGTEPWGFPWKLHYWCIGGDGAGGFYFIDTKEHPISVYYCDHEDMPTSIEDTDHIHVATFEEFVREVQEGEDEMEKWDAHMRERVASRRWWQFWIPKQWPPQPKLHKNCR
jgi:hypothetical protein